MDRPGDCYCRQGIPMKGIVILHTQVKNIRRKII